MRSIVTKLLKAGDRGTASLVPLPGLVASVSWTGRLRPKCYCILSYADIRLLTRFCQSVLYKNNVLLEIERNHHAIHSGRGRACVRLIRCPVRTGVIAALGLAMTVTTGILAATAAASAPPAAPAHYVTLSGSTLRTHAAITGRYSRSVELALAPRDGSFLNRLLTALYAKGSTSVDAVGSQPLKPVAPKTALGACPRLGVADARQIAGRGQMAGPAMVSDGWPHYIHCRRHIL
jgi:hypothetical protein